MTDPSEEMPELIDGDEVDDFDDDAPEDEVGAKMSCCRQILKTRTRRYLTML